MDRTASLTVIVCTPVPSSRIRRWPLGHRQSLCLSCMARVWVAGRPAPGERWLVLCSSCYAGLRGRRFASQVTTVLTELEEAGRVVFTPAA